jgi:uncharacterized protein (TIGR03083 family)
MSTVDYLSHLDRESRRFAAVLDGTDPASPVPTCPEWNAGDLLWHLTKVQWFWGTIAVGRLDDPAEAETSTPERPTVHRALLDLFATATDRLMNGLADRADETPVWTWAHDRTLGFIRRRQANEALIHRLDAELVAGEITPMDPALSADGVDEVLRVMWAELPDWARFQPGDGDLTLETTDTGNRWRVRFGRFVGTSPTSGTSYDEPTLAVVDAVTRQVPAASIRGQAGVIYRWLWGRGDVGVERSGSPTVLSRLDHLIAVGMQ